MQITLEITNPYFASAIEDMTKVTGLDEHTLCAGLIEKQLSEYNREVSEAKMTAAAWRLSERLNRIVLKSAEEDEDNA